MAVIKLYPGRIPCSLSLMRLVSFRDFFQVVLSGRSFQCLLTRTLRCVGKTNQPASFAASLYGAYLFGRNYLTYSEAIDYAAVERGAKATHAG
jgi:hypothetical protein